VVSGDQISSAADPQGPCRIYWFSLYCQVYVNLLLAPYGVVAWTLSRFDVTVEMPSYVCTGFELIRRGFSAGCRLSSQWDMCAAFRSFCNCADRRAHRLSPVVFLWRVSISCSCCTASGILRPNEQACQSIRGQSGVHYFLLATFF
jgi:hypothetical protein